jgi:hypothetical protein
MSVQMLENTKAGQAGPVSPDGAAQMTWQCDVCGLVMLDLHCKLRFVQLADGTHSTSPSWRGMLRA